MKGQSSRVQLMQIRKGIERVEEWGTRIPYKDYQLTGSMLWAGHPNILPFCWSEKFFPKKSEKTEACMEGGTKNC